MYLLRARAQIITNYQIAQSFSFNCTTFYSSSTKDGLLEGSYLESNMKKSENKQKLILISKVFRIKILKR